MKGYFKNIENNAFIEIKTIVPLIKSARKDHKATTGKPITAVGYSYILLLEPTMEINEQGEITVTLKWEDEKEQKSQTITIKQEESNLIPGSYIYYFLSNSHKCRKLFYINQEFKSRKEFKHQYKLQGKNRERQKEIAFSKSPYRRYGKEHYKGKLTPYGKRCQKNKLARTECLMKLFEDISETENSLATRMRGMLDKIDKNIKEAKSTYSKMRDGK